MDKPLSAEFMQIEVAGTPIIYTERHSATALAMAEAVEKTASIVARHWNLTVPKDCQVRMLENWEEFVDNTVPKRLRLLVKLAKPFWRRRAERAFSLSGGWMLPWRGHPSVGVKPPELLIQSETRLGEKLFMMVSDPLEKVKQLTCHEFTHACTAHLRLPPWLNEGLAMRAVDHMVGHPTVLEKTQDIIRFDKFALNSQSYRRIKPGDHDAIIQLYATGYWVTRKLEKENPAVLIDLLKHKRSIRKVSNTVKAALKLSHESEDSS